MRFDTAMQPSTHDSRGRATSEDAAQTRCPGQQAIALKTSSLSGCIQGQCEPEGDGPASLLLRGDLVILEDLSLCYAEESFAGHHDRR